jgi:protein-L-isoaspartate(D-aspartate) O-methyltransferase
MMPTTRFKTTRQTTSAKPLPSSRPREIDMELRRRCFAEEIDAVANLRTPALVDAFASVPRERYLRPGPWLICGDTHWAALPHRTPDADPRHTYHDCAIAIDSRKGLFSGTPGPAAVLIDALELSPGKRILHVGAGLGYYTAILAHVTGPSGRVLALEVDEVLAAEARANLSGVPWAEVRHANGEGTIHETYDAILVSAGVTHPQRSWLDALASSGRLVLPLTISTRQAGISRGVTVLLHRGASGLAAQLLTVSTFYSAIGLRNDALETRLRGALARMTAPRLDSLTRERHDVDDRCWYHAPEFCFRLA